MTLAVISFKSYSVFYSLDEEPGWEIVLYGSDEELPS